MHCSLGNRAILCLKRKEKKKRKEGRKGSKKEEIKGVFSGQTKKKWSPEGITPLGPSLRAGIVHRHLIQGKPPGLATKLHPICLSEL